VGLQIAAASWGEQPQSAWQAHLHAGAAQRGQRGRLRARPRAAAAGQQQAARAAPRQPRRQRQAQAAQAAGDQVAAVRPAPRRGLSLPSAYRQNHGTHAPGVLSRH